MSVQRLLACMFQSVCRCVGGQSGHLDVQSHWVTALAWPHSKGLIEGCLGLTIDSLLVGRVDGSVAVIEVFDSSTFCRKELQHCSRTGGKCELKLSGQVGLSPRVGLLIWLGN